MTYHKKVIENTPVGDISIYVQDDYIIKIGFGKYEKDEYDISEGFNQALITAEIQLDQYLHGLRKDFDLKICYDATEYQQTVWHKLCTVRYDNTITYKELAEKCGNIKASRSVANALSKNPLPIIIPCHRVISSNGTIGGYTPNISIKRRLLEIEEKYKHK